VVGIRFTVGGFLLLLLSFVTGRLKSLPKKNEILSALLLATLLLLMGNGFITIAEQRIASYVIALLISSTPIVVAFFNKIIFGMKIGFIKFAGILVGTAGVAFLLYDGSSIFLCWITPYIYRSSSDALWRVFVQKVFSQIFDFCGREELIFYLCKYYPH